jgi:hypothetical protein
VEKRLKCRGTTSYVVKTNRTQADNFETIRSKTSLVIVEAACMPHLIHLPLGCGVAILA